MTYKFIITHTEYGKVRGKRVVSALNTKYFRFLGIPYAKKPIGKLRFKDPQKPNPWNGIYDATEQKPHCLGIDDVTKQVTGSEDSLYLNVFTKNLNPTKPYPVMVYIYGGGFLTGSSDLDIYSPDYLLMADVVVVTFNYRVGPLGFLYLKDPTLNVPGNAGLKDQLAVLKFVKNNIANFGGDPNNITVFGHSAGGASVSHHLVAEASKNLFHRAIIMSGCVFNYWALVPEGDWVARLLKALGYAGTIEDEREILTFLQNTDPIKITEAQQKVLRLDELIKITFAFAPHIEPYVTKDTFISRHPKDLVRTAWSNEIDILIGGTSDEGLVYLEPIQNIPPLLPSIKLTNMVPLEVSGLSVDDPIRLRFVEKLQQTYYSSFDADPRKDELAFCKLQTDKAIWHGLQRLVQSRQLSYGAGKTFLYQFAVDSPTHNHYKIVRFGPDLRGACHGDEISYLFKNKWCPVPERNTLEFKSIERFISVFTSFASTGNPNSNVIGADMEDVEWKPVNTCEPPFKCLNFDEHLKFEEFPGAKRLAVWDELYKLSRTPLC